VDHRWADALWGGSGAFTVYAIKRVLNYLHAAEIRTAHEAKILGEQIKLMATSLNAVALAIVASTFV